MMSVRASKTRPRSSMRLRDGRVIRFPAVMGVLNVTPDSFSDGGRYLDPDRAVAHGREMARAGAAIIDVGGESTRPGAAEVPVDIELKRTIPVIRELIEKVTVPLSIDTRKAPVAEAALDAGAAMVNDISGFAFDPAMARLVARRKALAVLMHMRGTPDTMMEKAHYRDVVREVSAELRSALNLAIRSGVSRTRIILDPGIGFAKNAGQNLQLLAALPRLCRLGCPLLIGLSRKSFVSRIAGRGEAELAFGTAAGVALAIYNGASLVRVHDVAEMVPVVRMATAIRTERLIPE